MNRAEQSGKRGVPADRLSFGAATDPVTGFLCTGHPVWFRFEGAIWPSVEHAYQAQKTRDPIWRERIRQAPTARDARNVGGSLALPLRADWREYKRVAMLRAVAARYCLRCGPAGESAVADAVHDWQRLLLGTRGHYLTAVSATEAYWGESAEGVGANHLGRILCAIRDVAIACDDANLRDAPLTARDEPGVTAQDVVEPAAQALRAEATVTDCAARRQHFSSTDATALADRLHARIVFAAWRLLGDATWQPDSRAPGLHVHMLTRGLGALSASELREQCRALLERPLSALWVLEIDGKPAAVLLRGVNADWDASERWLRVAARERLRFACWPQYSIEARWIGDVDANVLIESVPGWRCAFHAGGHASDAFAPLAASGAAEGTRAHVEWFLRRVDAKLGEDRDSLFAPMQWFKPAAEALRLEFESELSLATSDTAPAARRAVVIEFAAPDNIAPTLPSFGHCGREWLEHAQTAVGPPAPLARSQWRPLLFDRTRGALPALEAAFGADWGDFGIELPPHWVVARLWLDDLADDVAGFSGWQMIGLFGQDARGEYLDLDASHRHAGESFIRYYADGAITRREAAIPAALLHAQRAAISRAMAAPQQTSSAAAASHDAAAAVTSVTTQRGRRDRRIAAAGIAAVATILLGEMLWAGVWSPGLVVFTGAAAVLAVWVLWRPEHFDGE